MEIHAPLLSPRHNKVPTREGNQPWRARMPSWFYVALSVFLSYPWTLLPSNVKTTHKFSLSGLKYTIPRTKQVQKCLGKSSCQQLWEYSKVLVLLSKYIHEHFFALPDTNTSFHWLFYNSGYSYVLMFNTSLIMINVVSTGVNSRLHSTNKWLDTLVLVEVCLRWLITEI